MIGFIALGVGLAMGAAQAVAPPSGARAEPEPLIVTQSTVEDFDPGFVAPPPESSVEPERPVPPDRPATGARPLASESDFERARRNFEAEIRRLEAIIARTKAMAAQ